MHLKDLLTNRERLLLDLKVNNETGCWEWQRSVLQAGGYGQYNWKGKMRRAHVESYKEFVGPVGDLCVLHKCDNPKCCNPNHLFLGTRTDNAIDRNQKGRTRHKSRKLSDEQIQEYRRRRWEGNESTIALAKEAGVHQSTMSRVTSKRPDRNRYLEVQHPYL